MSNATIIQDPSFDIIKPYSVLVEDAAIAQRIVILDIANPSHVDINILIKYTYRMSKRLSEKTINQIKKFRERGWSLPEIHKELGVGYGTIHRHINDVRILPKYEKMWLGKRGGSIKRKKEAEKEAYEKAKKYILQLSDKEKTIFLCALYWGEGSKSDFGISNTDPELIRVFAQGLVKVFGISRDDFRISVRIFEDLDKEKCLDFWSQIVGIPREKFVNVNILKGKKEGKTPYGMCRLRVRKGGKLLKYITALKKRISYLF